MQTTPVPSKTWRRIRRGLVSIAVLVTLVALFYAEENWRGKRAWEQFRREMEAKGEPMDWAAFIPPPVPDDQNVFKAPKMTEWFVGRGANELTKSLNFGNVSAGSSKKVVANGGRVLVAEVTVVPPGAYANTNNIVWQIHQPGASAVIEKILGDAIGPVASMAAGFTVVARPLEEITPAHILLPVEDEPAADEIANQLPAEPILLPIIDSGHNAGAGFEVDGPVNGVFQIWLKPPAYYTAAEYLDWSTGLASKWDVLREALKRPEARMDGDYNQGFTLPLPNFLAFRAVAQALNQQTQCELLLGRPEAALNDLTLAAQLHPLLLGGSRGKPLVLVSAMVDAAVTGPFTRTVSDGLRLDAWREPQLAALEQQLLQVNLPPSIREAFREERALNDRAFLSGTAGDYDRYETSLLGGDRPLWKKMTDPMYLYLHLGPRGWLYQNQIVHGRVFQSIVDVYDSPSGVISPARAAKPIDDIQTVLRHRTPYNALTAASLPNFTRVSTTVARIQTTVNEAAIACALERFRLAHREYPSTLADLTPQFIASVPNDVINGEPLKYHRSADGKFVLYSVGWNEKDDGGAVAMKPDGKTPVETQGDWVWPQIIGR